MSKAAAAKPDKRARTLITPEGLALVEMAEGVTETELATKTGVPFKAA